MVSFLPRIYPNELLYSFVARFHLYMFNRSPKYTSVELFGHPMQLAVPDLPTNIGAFHNNTNKFLGKEIGDLINDHTFFYFYTNFKTLKQRSSVKNIMINGDKKGAVHMTTGVMAYEIKDKQYFHHCSECVVEDLKNIGETYWHLEHQIPGVFICSKHDVLLKKTNVPFRSKERNLFHPAIIKGVLVPCLDIINEETFEKLRSISLQCVLLAKKQFNFDIENLQEKYKILLKKKGFTSKKGKIINQKELAKQFQNFYGNEILKIMQASVCYENSSCWLKNITRKHRKSFHPIHHILIIHFLGETLETIERVCDEGYYPFGEGPFPCLNKAASHFGELIIPSVEVTVCSKTKRTIGIFRCDCGFHYTRNNPNNENKHKISRVKQFGDLWIKFVVDLVHKKKKSYSSVARQLDVDTKTVIKYANLSMNERKKPDSPEAEIMQNKKSEWLCLIKENPGKSVTELRTLKPALYAFFYRNDKQWLKENSPKKKREKNKGRVNWEMRDRLLKGEIEMAVKKVLGYEPPVRITISCIGKEIGKKSILERHLQKLPKTQEILGDLTEDIAAFQRRRIKYYIEKTVEAGEELREWKLRRDVGLKDSIDKDLIKNIFEQINNITQEELFNI